MPQLRAGELGPGPSPQPRRPGRRGEAAPGATNGLLFLRRKRQLHGIRIETLRAFASGGVAVECRGVDAAERARYEGGDDQGEDRQRDRQDEQCPAPREGGEDDQRETAKKHAEENEPESGAEPHLANDVLAPGLL